MTAQHTPGPWKLKLGKGVEYDYIINGGAHLVACFAHYKHFTKKETKANARLIAAAPDLLEALKLLMASEPLISAATDVELEYGLDDEDELVRTQENAWLVARAAIAKATGVKP